MFKKILKFIGAALLAVTAFLSIYLLAAFILSHIAIGKVADTPEEIAIYIKTNGVHTDIVVPVRTAQIDWSKEVKYSNTALKDTTWPYLAMGWGDKGFYLQTPNWSDLKVSVAFNAAFGRSTTAMHTTFYAQMHENERCRKIMISHKQYIDLINYLLASFRGDSSGHIVNIATTANYGISDAFYEANGSYSLFYTCNSWANTALRISGQRCCVWTVFDSGIFSKYE